MNPIALAIKKLFFAPNETGDGDRLSWTKVLAVLGVLSTTVLGSAIDSGLLVVTTGTLSEFLDRLGLDSGSDIAVLLTTLAVLRARKASTRTVLAQRKLNE